MADAEHSREVNRRHWDERAPAHAASPDYGVVRFAEDSAHLSSVVRFDLPRLGARMTGLDFSAASIDEARRVARLAGVPVDFVHAEVTEATSFLEPGAFDLVYTGIGALCWLPDIGRRAGVVAALLRPGGRLFVREGHPVLWALDAGLVLTQLVEHESVPWNPFPEGMMRLSDDGEWRLIDRPERLPLTYTLQARKPLVG